MKSWKQSLLAFVTCCAGILTPIAATDLLKADELPPGHDRRRIEGVGFQLKQFHVTPGNDQAARTYYRKTLSPQMGFESAATIEGSSIKSLLTYFGYPNVSAGDLHRLKSQELMALGAAGDILATAFFAPKITDVQEKPTQTPTGGFGWRKLVRLNAKAGSDADKNGMQAVYILQNVFEAAATSDPFKDGINVSKFNQVIAIRKIPSNASAAKHATYFMTYGPFVKVDANNVPIKTNGQFQDAGQLTTSLAATFNEGDRDPETNSAPKEYFVPASCVQCHGGVSIKAKVNYLDTDHWFDRVTPAYGLADPKFSQEDFTLLSQSPYGVLYDGNKDVTKPEFAAAFAVIKQINEEIKAQNRDVGGEDSFQFGAVSKWLKLHESDITHVPPYRRGFGVELWDSENEDHRKALYYLNRYCFRCHSSLKYNIFDRHEVKRFISNGEIESRVLNITQPETWMPQDRILPGLSITGGVPEATGDLKEFLDLLPKVK